jgi:hypothetical protein
MLCAMKAIYDSRIYNVVDVVLDIILEGRDGKQISVDLSDERLIVDPTDSEVADASNLAEWYGVDSDRAKQLRLMLLGEIPLDQWQRWKSDSEGSSL